MEGLERKLYCYCQQPSSKDLLGCDYCPQWYHPNCLNLTEESLQTILQLPSWRCPECQARTDDQKLHHRQLQLPIPQGGKFCEVKTCRLESWGLEDYQEVGWIPVTPNTWRSRGHQPGSPPDTQTRRKRVADSVEQETPAKRRSDQVEGTERSNKENVETEHIAKDVRDKTEDQKTISKAAPKMKVLQKSEPSTNVDKELHLKPYEELFFCFECKSIFLSSGALESHQYQQHTV